jgi:hypothetical protein
MPVPKVPQYGDAARLAQLASGLKREHGTYGSVVQRNEPGRPTEQTQGPAPEIPAEHQGLMAQLAQAEIVRQRWAALAQSSPTPWIMGMRKIAEDNYQRIAQTYYDSTPNFE